jgi:valyl-tRNA synthetase
MDTWMTSSLTPQINAGSDDALTPMSLRVQAFEIIRTWLFYTVVQSHLLFDRLPWRAVMISGWGLNEQGRKIAKRDLAGGNGFNRYDPDQVIDRYGADALRLWATRARIGNDLRYHEKDVRAGRKFAVKLWNVARFVAGHGDGDAPAVPVAERTAVDRWLLSHLAETADKVTVAFDQFDVMRAHQVASRFFWSVYCDRYVEMVKDRFRYPEEHSGADRASARATLRESLRVLLGLFAPFTPFVTEDLYQRLYRPDEGSTSLHLTGWPVPPASWRSDRTDVDRLATVLDRVRALRSELRLGGGARLSTLVIQASTAEAKRLVTAIAEPLRTAARAEAVVEGDARHDSGVPGITIDVVR